MPYLGNELATQFQAFATQTITGDGSTSYTLDRAVANGKELLVYINNVKQEEGSGKSYEASGTTITFSEAVASGDSCYLVYMGSAQQTVTAPAGSIVSSQLATAFPSASLDMNGTELILDADGDTSITSDTDDRVDVKIGGSDIAHITSTGVGIGTTSPSHELHITGSSDTRAIITSGGSGDAVMMFENASGNTWGHGLDLSSSNYVIGYNASGDPSLTSDGVLNIDTSGNVLVGGTNNDDGNDGIKLRASGELVVEQDDSLPVKINKKTSHGELIRLQSDGSTIGGIGSYGASGLFIESGDVGLAFRGDLDAIYPVNDLAGRDNAIDLGLSNTRFDDIYATNGTIQTSDQNEKQDIASATTKELNVAKKLSALFKTFRWKDKVAEKGDKARTHTGIIAQEIQSAFSAEGLDASNYGLFTSNTWWEKEISVDAVKADKEKDIEAKDAYTYMDIKEEKTDGYTEKTRLGVRYPELFSFIFSSIEARLTALESK